MFALRRRGLLNLLSLAALQGSNALVPLIVFPYALGVLGPGPYADVVIAEAISIIVLTLVLFSFEVDGVARVSALSLDADRDQISRHYTTILSTQLGIFVIASVIAVVAHRLLTSAAPGVMLGWLLVPLGYILQAGWLYQGLERNVPLAAIILPARVACVATVLATLRGPHDAMLVPAAVGGSFVVGGLGSLLFALLAWKLRIRSFDRSLVWSTVREGKEIFLGNASVLLYRGLNVLILGAAGAPPPALAAYSLAEKFVNVLQASVRPLTQLYLPPLLRGIRDWESPNVRVARVVARSTLPQLLLLMIAVLGLLAMFIIANGQGRLTGLLPQAQAVAVNVAIMVPSMFFGISNFTFGVVGLNYLNARGYLLRAIMTVGLINVALCYALSHALGAIGAALSVTIAEALLLLQILARYGVDRRQHLSGRSGDSQVTRSDG